MAQRKKAAPEKTSNARVRFLLAEMRHVRGFRRQAEQASLKAPSTWGSVATLSRQLQSLRAEYDEAKAQIAIGAAFESKDSTPEQWIADRDSFYRACPMQDLDAAVLIWAERNKVLISKDDKGQVHLHYREEQGA